MSFCYSIRTTMQATHLIFRLSLASWICVGPLPAQAPQQQTAQATLTVTGDIPSTLVLNPDDLAKMPRETAAVADQDGTKVLYEGVLLREILKRAGAPSEKGLRGKAPR